MSIKTLISVGYYIPALPVNVTRVTEIAISVRESKNKQVNVQQV